LRHGDSSTVMEPFGLLKIHSMVFIPAL